MSIMSILKKKYINYNNRKKGGIYINKGGLHVDI